MGSRLHLAPVKMPPTVSQSRTRLVMALLLASTRLNTMATDQQSRGISARAVTVRTGRESSPGTSDVGNISMLPVTSADASCARTTHDTGVSRRQTCKWQQDASKP